MAWFDSVVDSLAGVTDLLLPWRCAGCRAPGDGWCAACAAEIGGIRRVRRPLLDPEVPVYALGRYRGSARRTVLAYKEDGRRDLAGPLGARIADGLRAVALEHPGALPAGGSCVLVPAPSRRAASRRRGGAHMARVARRAVRHRPEAAAGEAERLVRFADCLALRRGVRDSVGLDAVSREQNLAGRLLVRAGDLPSPRAPVVLVDDVLTTGATLASCTRVLRAAGHRVVAAVVLTATATPSAGWPEQRERGDVGTS